MKLALTLFALSVSLNLNAQTVKIALTENSTVSSGEVVDYLTPSWSKHNKECEGVTLTATKDTADYTVELDRRAETLKISGGNKGREDYSAVLFSKKGEVLWHSKTHVYAEAKLGSVIADTCKAIRKLQ